jgi:hypothetical protein
MGARETLRAIVAIKLFRLGYWAIEKAAKMHRPTTEELGQALAEVVNEESP